MRISPPPPPPAFLTAAMKPRKKGFDPHPPRAGGRDGRVQRQALHGLRARVVHERQGPLCARDEHVRPPHLPIPPPPYKLDAHLPRPRTNRTRISPDPVQIGRASPPTPYKSDAHLLPSSSSHSRYAPRSRTNRPLPQLPHRAALCAGTATTGTRCPTRASPTARARRSRSPPRTNRTHISPLPRTNRTHTRPSLLQAPSLSPCDCCP